MVDHVPEAQDLLQEVGGPAGAVLRGYDRFKDESYDAIVNCVGLSDPAKIQAAGVEIFRLTERFDESMLLFQARFGWRLPLYLKEHVRRGKAELPDSALDRVRRHNELDAELYVYAKDLFGQVRDEDLRRFRRWNRPYAAAYGMLRPLVRAILPSS